ncbi:MAG: hypothetical protein ACYDCK_05015 [Thermoplasmatota archaeon]
MLPLVAFVPLLLAALPTVVFAALTPTQGLIAAAIAILIVLIIWKLFKVALKIAIIVAVVWIVIVALRHFGVI